MYRADRLRTIQITAAISRRREACRMFVRKIPIEQDDGSMPNDTPTILTIGTTPTLARTMRFARLEVDGVNRALEVREYAAGKSINAARAIANLCGNALVLTIAGGGRGIELGRLLDAAQLKHRLITTF